MSTCVCVLSNSGERLMPTIRLGKVRRLLKDGKAKIIKHHPFTIQLLYDSKANTQPIEICEDVGYKPGMLYVSVYEVFPAEEGH